MCVSGKWERNEMRNLKILLMTAAALALTGCAGSSGNAEAPAETSAAAETPAAETAAAETAEAPAEEGQNPVMNVVGEYGAGRAGMTVRASGKDDAVITVHWGNGANAYVLWTMSGKFDTDALTVSYSDCVKTSVELKDDGSEETETIEYENGTGVVDFSKGGVVTWQDDQENIAEDLEFTPNYVIEETDPSVYLGTWVCERATIEITEAEEDYKAVVTWGSSATEVTVWEYDVYFDGWSMVSFETGTKTNFVYNSEGKEVSSETVFDDGATALTLKEDGTLTWYEFKEDAGADMSFERMPQ